jgi:hypothetical protein
MEENGWFWHHLEGLLSKGFPFVTDPTILIEFSNLYSTSIPFPHPHPIKANRAHGIVKTTIQVKEISNANGSSSHFQRSK